MRRDDPPEAWPARTAYRREAGADPAKVWWHRDLAPAHTSRAFRHWRYPCNARSVRDLPAAEPGSTVRLQGWVHRRRELAALTFLVVRDRSGLAQVVGPRGHRPAGGDHRRGHRYGDRQRAGAGRDRGDRPADHAADRAGRDPAGRAVAAGVRRRTADAARPRAGDLAAPARRRRVGSSPRPRCADSATPSTRPGSPRSRRPSSWSPRRSRAPTSSRSTTSAGRRTSRRARSSTSSSWSASSSGSTRSARCSGPSRTTPSGTWPSTSPSTPSCGFVGDHRDVLAVLREVIAGMVAGRARARRRGGGADRRGRPGGARRDPGAPLPRRAGPGRRPRGRARPGAGARARDRRLGPAEHGSDFVAVEGYPMVKRPFYTHPQPDDPRWSNSFDLIFRGLELVTGGQRLHRPSRLRRRDPGERRGPGGVRGVPAGLPARDAAARRLRDRAGAVDEPPHRRRERARGHAVPARPAPTHALNLHVIPSD